MSKIALTINDSSTARTQIAKVIRTHLQIELGHVLKAIDEKRVIVEQPLFPRDDPTFPERMLSALEALDQLPISYTVFELLDNQTFAGQSRDSLYRITTDRLRTMIDARKKSLEEIRRQMRREEGVD
jgi:hypothetical protein